jgi:hypothetical protein
MIDQLSAYGWTEELMKAVERLRRMGYRVNRLENGDFTVGMGDSSSRLSQREILTQWRIYNGN